MHQDPAEKDADIEKNSYFLHRLLTLVMLDTLLYLGWKTDFFPSRGFLLMCSRCEQKNLHAMEF